MTESAESATTGSTSVPGTGDPSSDGGRTAGRSTAPRGGAASSGHRRRPARLLALLLLAVVLAAGASAAWLGWRGLQARDALERARPVAERVQDHVLAGDAAAARRDLAGLQDSARTARARTHDPVWDAASRLPWLGDDVRAVRQVTSVVDDVARRAMPPLVEAAGGLDPRVLQPVDGAVDLAALRAAAPGLQRAHTAMRAASEDARAIDTAGVDARIGEPVAQLARQLAAAARSTGTGSRAAALLPSMLGADGPRTYLVLFQNNAEPRALGGIVGATALVRADAGRLELVSQRPAGGFGPFPEPVLPLSQEQLDVHGARLGRFVQNVTATPDFDTGARLAREMYRRETGVLADGVVATDPVALSYLLRATGPVDLATGQRLTADDAVETLLSRVYATYPDTSDQDAFFAAAAVSVFRALMDGRAEPAAMARQLARAAREGRTLVWSADSVEQERLHEAGLAGGLAGAAGGARIGVYLNDATAAKMGYYLRPTVSVARDCAADLPTYTVRVGLRSTAPADAAQTLPEYVLGGPTRGDLPAGGLRTKVLVYAPAGGGVAALRLDGAPARLAPQVERGRPVASVLVDLLPGQEAVVEADVVDASGGSAPVLRMTPGPRPTDLPQSVTGCSRD